MIETNWIILTGSACSGKSELISRFKNSGFSVQEEIARDYLNRYYAGVPFDKIPWSSVAFQKNFLSMTIEREKRLDPEELLFFDRGALDTYAYSAALHGISKEQIYQEHPFKYKSVFLLESLPLVHDELRKDSDEHVSLQNKSLRATYESFGYEIIDLPRFSDDKEESISQRLRYIKEKLAI